MTDTPDLSAIASRNGFGDDTAKAALAALRKGGGRQAQFNIAELGGMGQWSGGGMLQIGDMFNDGLKARVAALFKDLAPLTDQDSGDDSGDERGAGVGHGGGKSSDWPATLGSPSTSGSQNGVRYAVFPDKQRLAIERDGKLTVYDTGDRRINGVGQQQGGTSTLRFSASDGTVDLDDLPQVDAG